METRTAIRAVLIGRKIAASRKPNSVSRRHPCGRRRDDDHSSSPVIADRIERPTRGPSDGPSSPPIWSCSVRGFACHPCHHGRGALLPHLFTLTAGKGRRRRGSGIARRGPESFFYRDGRTTIPDPGRNDSRPPSPRPVPEAVCFLCHCPSARPDRALPGALPWGVRTFPPPSRLAALGGGGRLAPCDVPIVPLECRTDRPRGWAGWAYGHIGPTLRSYPSVSWLIWYCSSFLYR